MFNGFGQQINSFGSFGQPQQQPQANASSPSLFGQPQQPAASSPFTAPMLTSQPSSTGLFGTQAQQPAAQSPFGSTAAQPSPFGSNTLGQGIGMGQPGAMNTTNNQLGAQLNPIQTGGIQQQQQQGMGTSRAPFAVRQEQDLTKGNMNKTDKYETITMMREYQGEVLQDLRLQDYAANRKTPQSATNKSFGGFGAQQNTSSSLFGAQQQPAASPFGSTQNTAFGSQSSPSLFGRNNNTATGNTGSLFGQSNNAATNSSGGFGAKPAGSPSLFSQNNNSAFGGASSPSTATGTGFGFGANNTVNTAGNTSGELFGNNNNTSSFGQPKPFGQPAATPSTGFGFGTSNTNQQSSPFGQPAAQSPFGTTNNASGFGQQNKPEFGSAGSSGLFGSNNNASGSTFGQPQQPGSSFGGFGQNNSNLQQGGLFGQPNNNNAAGGMFGQNNNTATNQQGGLFGQENNNTFGQPQQGNTFGQQNKPMFGQSSTATSTFGQSNNTSGGLFGAKPAGTGLFGQQQQPQQSGGLFGNNNNASTGPSLFGNNINNNNNNTAIQQQGGLFGQQNNTSGGRLFGTTQNKPADGGLFGSSTQQQSAGGIFSNTAQNTSGGLFGNPQNNTAGNTSGGLFGSSNNATQANPQQSGGLFDNKPAGGLFGASNTGMQPQSGGLFGSTQSSGTSTTGGGLFGSKPAGTTGGTGLFGSTTQNKPTSGVLFGSNNTATSQPAFGTTGNAPYVPASSGGLFANYTPNTQAPVAAIDSNVYLQHPLFSGIGGQDLVAKGQVKQQPMAVARNDPTARPPVGILLAQNLEPTPLPKGRRLGTVSSETDRPDTRTCQEFSSQTAGSPSTSAQAIEAPQPASAASLAVSAVSVAQPEPGTLAATSPNVGRTTPTPAPEDKFRRVLFSNNTDDIILNSEAFDFTRGRRLELGTSVRTTSTPSLGPTRRRQAATPVRSSSPKSTVDDGYVDVGHSLANYTVEDYDNEDGRESPVVISSGVSDDEGLARVDSDEAEEEAVAGPATLDTPDNEVVDARGYWISPAEQKIANMTLREIRNMKDFRVGQRTHGFVEFLEPVDLSHFIDIQKQICEHIIVFGDRSFCLYPNLAERPPVGQGFNVKHRVTLYNVFARARDTKEAIKDPHHPVVKKFIKRLQAQQKFVSWSPQTGTWTFEVDPTVSTETI